MTGICQATESDSPAERFASRDEDGAVVAMTEMRLRQSPYLALRTVSCEKCHDGLHLHGRLPSYYLKQMAQEIAMHTEGVDRVVNEVVVQVPTNADSSQSRVFTPTSLN